VISPRSGLKRQQGRGGGGSAIGRGRRKKKEKKSDIPTLWGSIKNLWEIGIPVRVTERQEPLQETGKYDSNGD